MLDQKVLEKYDGIALNQGSHKLNSQRSAENPSSRKERFRLNQNIKINQKRREKPNQRSNIVDLLIRFPSRNHKNTLHQKEALESTRHSVYSSKNALLDSSQNSYSTIFAQNDKTRRRGDENFLSLGIKISFSETSSTSMKTKEAVGKTNLTSLIFVALRHHKPQFQTFEQQPNEDSNVMYGPLALLIKAAGNGMVSNEDNERIKVEIDFPTKIQHQSTQQMSTGGYMRKVFQKYSVGNSTYGNFEGFQHQQFYSCVVWDEWLKTFKKDSKVCQTLSINATHTKCLCNQIGRFGLVNDNKGYKDGINYELNGPIINDYNGGKDALFDIDDDDDIEDKNDKGLATKEEGNEEIINNNNIEWLDNEIEYKDSTTFMIIIITISSTVLVASVLGIGLLVFYCKRVKVRLLFIAYEKHLYRYKELNSETY